MKNYHFYILFQELITGLSNKVIKRKMKFKNRNKNFFLAYLGSSKIFGSNMRSKDLDFQSDINYFLGKSNIPSVRFIDFIGIEIYFKEICNLMKFLKNNSEFYRFNLIPKNNALILSGPSGTGKTFFANVLAGELGFNLLDIQVANGSSNKIKKAYSNAQNCNKYQKYLLLMDNLDNFFSTETSNNSFESKSHETLMSSLRKIKDNFLEDHFLILILEKSEKLKPLLKKVGIFFKELEFRIPSTTLRLQLISTFSKKFYLPEDHHKYYIMDKTKGLVTRDILHIFIKASEHAIWRETKRILGGFYRKRNNYSCLIFNVLKLKDILFVINKFRINCNKNRVINLNEVSWSEIGGLENTKKIISKFIIEPILYGYNKKYSFGQANGILLNGPPGCGKTLIANAAARESGANFVYIKGPEILDKYLGESEKAIRKIFSDAKQNSPTIIFFDEFDSLASDRNSCNNNSSSGDRVVNQLLTEIDNFNEKNLIFLIAATNRLDIIDKAFLRPGRFDHIININFPSYNEKISILKTSIKKINILPGINSKLISFCFLRINFTGADISWIIKKAVVRSKDDKLYYTQSLSNKKGLSIKFNLNISIKDIIYDFI